MGKARDDAGNIWETDAAGNAVRLLQPANPGMGPAIGNDPKLPGALQGQGLSNQRTAIDIQNAPLDRTGKVLSNQRTAQDIALDQSKFAVQVKDQYDKDTRVAKYRSVLPNVIAGMQAGRNKQGDLTVVYAWAKTMDETGSVREGDTDLATSTSSYIQQAQSYIARINQGKGLPPEVRDGLINEMRNKARQLRVQYDDARNQYTGLAKQGGLDPDLVIGPRDGDKFRDIEKAFREKHGAPHERIGQDRLNTSGLEAKSSDAPIIREYDPVTSAEVDAMIRLKRPYAEIAAHVQGKGFNPPNPGEINAAIDYLRKNPNYTGGFSQATRLRNTSQMEQDAGAVDALAPGVPTGLAKGFTHTFDRGAEGLQNSFNSIFGTDFDSASQVAQDRGEFFAGRPADPTAELVGKIGGAGLFGAPFRAPAVAGAVGNLLAGDSRDAGGLVGDAALGAVGGKAADMLLKPLAGAISPKTDPAALRLHKEGVHLTPGRMIPGMSLFEDLADSYPLIAGKIDAGKQLTKETLNRVPANRALKPIGQSLPDDVPAGHEAVAFTQRALSDHYDNALRGQNIAIDPTFVTRLNALAARSNLRPQELAELGEIGVREIGGAFQATPNALGSMTGKQFKALDERLGKLSAGFKRSDDPYRRMLGEELDKVIEQTHALARRQSPDMASSLRAADEGWANFVPLRSAAAMNPADGLATPGQFRTAVRQSDRSVGRGATARGEALMQDFASDASKIVPEARGNSGTADRANLASVKAWLMGSLASPLYSKPVQLGLEKTLLREPGPLAQGIGAGVNLIPRGIFGATLPWYLQPGQ